MFTVLSAAAQLICEIELILFLSGILKHSEARAANDFPCRYLDPERMPTKGIDKTPYIS